MMRPTETVFAIRLAEIRERRRETFSEFARACGVSRRSMEAWIYGESEPLISYAMKVAMATGYDLDDLVDPTIDLPAGPRRAGVSPRLHLLPKGAVGSTQFADGFRAALQRARLQIKEVAELLELDRNTVSKWLSGACEPRVTSAMRAAALLGVRMHDLASGSSTA